MRVSQKWKLQQGSMDGQERDASHGCVDDGIYNCEGLPGDQIAAVPGRPSAPHGQRNGATWWLVGGAADGQLCWCVHGPTAQ